MRACVHFCAGAYLCIVCFMIEIVICFLRAPVKTT